MDWKTLHNLNSFTLTQLGFAQWDKPDADGKVLMLIPARLFPQMPNKLKVECIDGRKIIYNSRAVFPENGYVDNDERGGMLAYGFRVSV